MVFSESANFELQENKKAKIGHANANVYAIGFQYEHPIPVNTINSISTTLSIVR
ncbi:MAG: hypothetical protein J6J36_07360 [Clostridia bacterium]|nr:hypothetical protein [Clostridia bacterium]